MKNNESNSWVSNNLLPKRKYGQPINGENIGMTLASMIEANDPELGAYLNISTGYWRKKEEEKAARAMQIESMKMATEKLKNRMKIPERELSGKQQLELVH